MVTIAVDAMGGDHAPKPEVEGALRAVKQLGVAVILVGREDAVTAELDKHGSWRSLPIQVRHASEQITMDDSAAKAVRSKKDSSIRVACRLMKDGEAHGVVSAGNTGAVMATSKMVNGMIKGVDRPALATAMPTINGRPALLLDVGANVDSTPEMLMQFAIMGDIYYRSVFHNPRPRVGLLSIGEEEHKGNELTKAAAPLLKLLPIHFIGNVEGRDIFNGSADVIVCDGFTGNVLLKSSEGLSDAMKHMLQTSLKATISGQVGYLFARNAFADFKKRVDYSEYGGAPLLGVKGVTIICHGRSNPHAIRNAIRVAADLAKANPSKSIEAEITRSPALI